MLIIFLKREVSLHMKHKPDVFCMVGLIFMAVGAPFSGFGIWGILNVETLRNSPGATGDPSLLGPIFLLVGVVQFTLGLALAASWFRRTKAKDRAVSSGMFVNGRVTGICKDWQQTVNGWPLCYLTAEAEIGGRVKCFEGSRVRNAGMLPDIGSDVRIYIDKDTDAYAIMDMGGNML